MKPLFLSLILGASLLSCSSPYEVTPVFTKINEKTQDYEIAGTTLKLESSSEKVIRQIAPLNERLTNLSDSLVRSTKTQAVDFFTEYNRDLEAGKIEFPRPAFQYNLYLTDSMFVASEKIISIQVTAYVFSGGAHGNTFFYSQNFSPEKGVFYATGDILDLNKEDEINALLMKNFRNPADCFDQKPTLKLATTINVTAQSVVFTYAHYVLGAYACGFVTVEVPIAELKGIFKL